MNVYATHWIWNAAGDGCWEPPAATLGAIDFRPIPLQAIRGRSHGDTQPGCLLPTLATLSGDHALLGSGEGIGELAATPRMRSAWQSVFGYLPQGENLAELVYDQLTNGSDPAGDSACKPLMPTVNRLLSIFLAGQQVRMVAFRWGDAHTARIQELERANYRTWWELEQAGKIPPGTSRKALGYLCDKYRLRGTDDWKEVVPLDLQREIPGPLKPETSHSENFNQSDSTTLGPQKTWTEVLNNLQTVSNRVRTVTLNARAVARCEHDLSSADHYCEIDVPTIDYTGIAVTNLRIAASCCRFSASAETYYEMTVQANNTTGDQTELLKTSAGSQTSIAGPNAETPATPQIKVSANGSTIKGYVSSVERFSVTDTSITTPLRCGFRMRADDVTKIEVDNFHMQDIAASGIAGPLIGPGRLTGGCLINQGPLVR